MRTVGREVIGRLDYDLLIANANHPADVCHVTIAAGAAHRKGEVLEILDGGKCDILGTTAEDAVAGYILAEDVDAGEEDVVASAYRSGSFIRNALIVKEGYTLTAEDEAALRNGGIYLSDAVL